jgi:ParB family chromosome partitioning protein
MGHARALLALTLPSEQLKLREEIIKHSWSVRATEEGVNLRRPLKGPRRRRSVELAALEESLQRSLMTRVKIIGNDRRGKIEISYATPDELDRISTSLTAKDGM